MAGGLLMPDLNQKPPRFNTTDIFGNKVNLSDLDDNYTLLVFLRYAGCPWCNLTIHRLTLEHKRLRENKCHVIAFVQSEKEEIIKNIYDRHKIKPQFPIISDQQRVIYNKYAVKPSLRGSLGAITKIPFWVQSVKKHGYKQTSVDGNLFMVPAWFLINNRTEKIVKSKHGFSLYDQEAFIDIYDTLYYPDL